MKKVQKSSVLVTFNQLNKKRQKAIKMLFEDKSTTEEIAKKLNLTDRAIYKWKNNPKFVKAQHEYAVYQFDSTLPLAVKTLIDLLKHGKSEKVRLQAAQTIFKRAGLFSDNGNPELDKAKIRKAIAEAEIAEQQLKAIKDLDAPDDRTVIVDDIKELRHSDTDGKD